MEKTNVEAIARLARLNKSEKYLTLEELNAMSQAEQFSAVWFRDGKLNAYGKLAEYHGLLTTGVFDEVLSGRKRPASDKPYNTGLAGCTELFKRSERTFVASTDDMLMHDSPGEQETVARIQKAYSFVKKMNGAATNVKKENQG